MDAFADLPPTPAEHHRVRIFAVVARVLDHAARTFGSREAAFRELPFLAGYHDELAARGLADLAPAEAEDAWRAALAAFESRSCEHLPLRALRDGGLDDTAIELLLAVGLIEEDARFGLLFESLQIAGARRPTTGLLEGFWRDAPGGGARHWLRRLRELGLVHVVNPDAPRLEWALEVPALVWDALRGETHEELAPGLRHLPRARLLSAADLILPAALAEALARLPALLAGAEARTFVIRGLPRSGRRTLAGAVAHALGRGLLLVSGPLRPDDGRALAAGPLSSLLGALPVVVLDLAAGETADVPPLLGYGGPAGVVLGRQGSIRGDIVEQPVTLAIDVPDADTRARLWRRALPDAPEAAIDAVAPRFRLGGGTILRTAPAARAHARLAGREGVTPADVRAAARSLGGRALETLATRVEAAEGWGHLSVPEGTHAELRTLEARCRHRERLHAGAAPTLRPSAGVRALFKGPSGTGKTLAARLLASVLDKDLYRIDLASVVNKYIGETEKNLGQVFTLAEELDVVLLFDEGDALFARRTSVQSSNDRYANLETNYLLQRIEAFEGIVLVTTNAPESIDSAFQRRMDVVVEFRPPEAPERWAIWQLHLPREHLVEPQLLREIAGRCALTGGQIKNAVLHASLLALEDGAALRSDHLEAAVQREYRKSGAVCPLRRATAANHGGYS